MPLLKTRPPVAEVTLENEASFDVMSLRRLSDHPTVAPLYAQRAALLHKLDELEQTRTALVRRQAEAERLEAKAAATDPDWQPGPALRDIQAAIEDTAMQTRIVRDGMGELDSLIEAAMAGVREDIESRFNALRRPLINRVITALDTIVGANRELRAIEAL